MFVSSLIAKDVGRAVFHISASNWSVVHDRLSGKISYLAAHPELQPDTVDLQLMAHSLVNRVRLVNLLNRE
jgi:ABC-type iron transport system FetAB ATPase subunit